MKKISKVPPHLATRREFLRGSAAAGTGLMALGAFAPQFVVDTVQAAGSAALDKDGKILVLIKLGGGNDGLNTLAPVNDDTYHEFRPNIGIKKSEALMLNDDLGLNPACSGLNELYQNGDLAVIQDVGYPNSSRSHFSGQDFYERGGGLEFVGSGWLGRYLDSECPQDQLEGRDTPVATHISRHLPILLRSRTPQPVFSMLSSDVRALQSRSVADDAVAELLRKTVMAGTEEKTETVNYLNMAYMSALVTEERVRDAIGNYKPGATYPGTNLGRDLSAVASMISDEMGTRVYTLDTGGFDTHSNQTQRQAQLLGNLSDSISAFLSDLKSKGLEDKVIVMPFSEFGRRPYENGSNGTDHGSNSVFFVAGSSVNGGIYGNQPVIPTDRRSDLRYSETSTDFRQLYATIVDRWLDGNSTDVLRKEYTPVEFLS
tara:strand:- start:1158 stop:2447 length:1290 start_codon:yes stop_codon:yes gene_type:complete